MDTENPNLEANARKLKLHCLDELQWAAQHGTINLEATSQGSKLLAIVSTMATMLTGETQLVESMNSIIRLIGNRCPAIDLATMSARLTIKKALSYSIDGTLASSKRWSKFLESAGPLLQDMIKAGTQYLEVYSLTDRFAPITGVSWNDLHKELANTDLSLALPDVKVTKEKVWASAYSGKIRSSSKHVAKTKHDAASLSCFVVSRGGGLDDAVFLLQAFTYRSQIMCAIVQPDRQGNLVLKDNKLTFTYMSDILTPLFQPSSKLELCKVFKAQVASLFGAVDCLLNVVATDGEIQRNLRAILDQTPLVKVFGTKPHSAKKKVVAADPIPDEENIDAIELEFDPDACAEDAVTLASGYAFQEEAAEAQKDAVTFDDDLQTSAIDLSKHNQIQQAMRTEQGKRCADIDVLEQAVELVRRSHAKAEFMTQSELEEEAILLLISEVGRQQEKAKKDPPSKTTKQQTQKVPGGEKASGSTGAVSNPKASADDNEVLAILKRSEEDKQKHDSEVKRKCFEDHQVLIQALVADAEKQERAEEDGEESPFAFFHAPFADSSRPSRPPKPHSSFEAALALWQGAAIKTLDAFVDCQARATLPLGHNNEIAVLMSLPPDARRLDHSHTKDAGSGSDAFDYFDCICVHWVDVNAREGRIVRLDANNRVIYSPPNLFGKKVPSIQFPSEKFCDLIPAAGAQNRRQKGTAGALRDSLPDPVIRLLAFMNLFCRFANKDAC